MVEFMLVLGIGFIVFLFLGVVLFFREKRHIESPSPHGCTCHHAQPETNGSHGGETVQIQAELPIHNAHRH
jgi:hypothetical protein